MAPIGRHENRPHRATGGDSHGWRLSRVAPFGLQLGGWPQPGRSRRPPLGNHMLALSDWRTRTNICRRHVPGTRSGGGPICVAAWGHSLGRGPDLAARGDLASAITCWRSLFGALRRARSGDTFRGRPSIGLRNRGVAPIGPYGGGALRRPEAALGGGPNFVAAWSCNLGGGPNWAACSDIALEITGSQLAGWPQSGSLWRPRLGNHMLAFSDWRSRTGALGRTSAGDTF